MTAQPNDPHIGLVVEGQGDLNALPILLRRRLWQREIHKDILGKPVSCNGREKAVMPTGLEGFVAVAAARPGCRSVLVVVDGEKDLVCELGPSLLSRARDVTRLPVAICLAERTYEDWLFASCETLDIGSLRYRRTVAGLGAVVAALKPAKYVKPTWQPRLTERLDLDVAMRRSGSLRRMINHFDTLVDDLLEG
ncbi:MAG TPA: hypothetical protein VFM54_10925 [Micromonosporaceae bacterium]|nr:hypothetical protein [Micromonosporaceae bacterium]